MMTSLLQTINYDVARIWELRDKRVDDWSLMNSPTIPTVICVAYVYFVKVWGPQYMKDRSAFKLKEVLLVYNISQIVCSCWLFYELGRYGWFSGNYSFTCQPVDYSHSESALRIFRASYWFYILKFFDLFDTLFFVLRKKNSQISTLHVTHHALIILNTWPGIRFVGGGHACFWCFLNLFVHAIMYFYYFMSVMGPQYQKYLGWKRYLTTLQITQFVVGSIHCFQLIFIDCNFPIAFCWLIGVHEFLFLYLFIKFYKEAYVVQRKETQSSMPNDKNE